MKSCSEQAPGRYESSQVDHFECGNVFIIYESHNFYHYCDADSLSSTDCSLFEISRALGRLAGSNV